jgi:hypothetical protein
MSEVIARLNAALSDRYRVERELGSGGIDKVRAELFQPPVELRKPTLEFDVGLSETLLDLCVEPLEAQLVEAFKIGSVCCVHCVEPVHELRGNIVAQALVELL